VDKKSYLMTDESPVYVKPGKAYRGHASVNHSKDEYVRLGGFVHVNAQTGLSRVPRASG
jgi:hypothetical protein